MRWDGTRIRWAEKVPRRLISRLYDDDARATPDQSLIDDVAWRLWERCIDILRVTEAAAGRAPCPVCEQPIHHDGARQTVLECYCGWSLPWGEYQRSYQKKQLHGGAAVLAFERFVACLPNARTARDTMLAVDRLINAFHTWVKFNTPTRPVAANLLEGKIDEVVAFLDEIAGDANPDLARFKAWSAAGGALKPDPEFRDTK